METLTVCDAPFSLADLARRVRSSSNFVFAWEFYESAGFDLNSATDIRKALETIIANPLLHGFLQTPFVGFETGTLIAPNFVQADGTRGFPIPQLDITIEPLHEHARVEVATDFENILARAANDCLGAYSWPNRDATTVELNEIRTLFSILDEYRPYQLLPGNVPGCEGCGYDSHLFTSWFYNVVWDWCYLVAWPNWNILWIGCLTDTD